MSSPLVTIGIPTYNRPQGLRRVLEAAIGQTYSNLDIVISDNASPDPEVAAVTAEFAARDPRVRSFRHEKNIGPTLNFVFAQSQSRGEYFVWLADDDTVLPHFVEACVRTLEEDPGAVLAMTPVLVHDEKKGETKPRPIPASQGQSAYQHATALIPFMMQNPNLWFYGVYRSRVLPPLTRVSFGNDQAYMLDIADKGRFAIAGEVPGFIYTRGSGASGNTEAYRRFCGAENDIFFVAHYPGMMIRQIRAMTSLTPEEQTRLIRQFLLLCFKQRSYRKGIRKELVAAPWRWLKRLVGGEGKRDKG